MAHDALYHRTFAPNNSVDISPDELAEMDSAARRLLVAGLKNQYYAFTLTGRSLAWLWIKKKRDQDFRIAATPFEREFSKLLDPKYSRGLDPIVDGTLTVVGHAGPVGGSNLWAPRHTQFRDGMTLNIERVPIFACDRATARAHSISRLWVPVGATEERFHIATRVDGFVLGQAGVDIVGIEPTEFWLLDAVLIGKALAELGVAAGRQFVKSLIRRSGKRAVTEVLEGPTAHFTEEAIERIASGGVRVELTDKQGEALSRLADTLRKGGHWNDLPAADRTLLGSVFHKTVEPLSTFIFRGVGRNFRRSSINKALLNELRKDGGRVVFTEGELIVNGKKLFLDLAEINFNTKKITVIDLTSIERSAHVAKTRAYREALRELTGFSADAIEMRYVGDEEGLLSTLTEAAL